MSIFSADILTRIEALDEFLIKYIPNDHDLRNSIVQDMNAELLTPLIEGGEWSIVYSDEEMLDMIDQGLFPVVTALIEEARVGVGVGMEDQDLFDEI